MSLHVELEGILVYSDQPTKKLALVFELMEMNIYELIRGRRNYVSEDRIKSYMYQLMKGDPSSWH
jgi:renal tumor antigen